ncbi:MAG: ComEC/Rec2 family competence protein [Acidimicrobiia bacterium]
MSDPIGWWSLAAAAVAWWGVVAGGSGLGWGAVVVATLSLFVPRPVVQGLGAVLLLAVLVGWGQAKADVAVMEALVDEVPVVVALEGRLATDGRPLPPPGSGWYARFEPVTRDGRAWSGPDLLLSVEGGERPDAGTELAVRGRLSPRATTVSGVPVAGVVTVDEAIVVAAPSGLLAVASSIRDRIRTVVGGSVDPPASHLLVGFLVGDIDELDPVVEDELRAAGLAHYVAVSGSNVALFLAGWWVITLPLALRPRIRWAVGLAGLVLFATVTRWEPSVVRASAAAGLALASRRFGIVLSARAILGIAVAASVLVAPRLAERLGFQLSVAATLGLVVGAGRGRSLPGRALAATIAAQVAVAPLLLLAFGSVPAVAPLANLVAGPLVSAATVLGSIGALVGLGPVAAGAGWAASAVVVVARVAAPFPELGWRGFAVAAVALVTWRVRPAVRPVVAAGAAAALAVGLMGAPARPGPWVAFLDVGQGDAAVLRGASGATVVVDAGPDPVVLADRLRRLGVDRVDLLVLTHRHADHVTGATAVVGRLPVGEVWVPDRAEVGALGPILTAVDELGIPRRAPRPGQRAVVGDLEVRVLGPLRRYVSPNDESIVLDVDVGGMSVLLAGDIETWAQADLGPLRREVLKVPHQGAATSDPGWLAASAGRLSVISVGENDFGHPAAWVVDVLEATGSVVCRTDRGGDVVVVPGLDGPRVTAGCEPHSGNASQHVRLRGDHQGTAVAGRSGLAAHGA